MLPDTTPILRWTVVLAVLTALLVAGVTIASLPDTPSQPVDHPAGAAADSPVGDNDRAMLVALRQHGLWATPVAQQARQMASSPAVRALGGTFAADLENQSAEIRDVAGRLGVALPSQPSAQQQGWATQISGRSRGDYDRTVLSRLRAGCVTTAEAVARARTTTRDPSIRRLADRATALIGYHLTLLDPTKPAPPAPAQVSEPTAVLASASSPTHRAPTGIAPDSVRAVTEVPPAAEPPPAAPASDRTTIGLAVLVALGGALTLARLARLAVRRRP